MKSVIYSVLVGLALMGSVASASSNELSREQTVKLGLVVNMHGYNCYQPIIAFHKGQNQYGRKFVLTCQSGKFNVIIRPGGAWMVTPK